MLGVLQQIIHHGHVAVGAASIRREGGATMDHRDFGATSGLDEATESRGDALFSDHVRERAK